MSSFDRALQDPNSIAYDGRNSNEVSRKSKKNTKEQKKERKKNEEIYTTITNTIINEIIGEELDDNTKQKYIKLMKVYGDIEDFTKEQFKEKINETTTQNNVKDIIDNEDMKQIIDETKNEIDSSYLVGDTPFTQNRTKLVNYLQEKINKLSNTEQPITGDEQQTPLSTEGGKRRRKSKTRKSKTRKSKARKSKTRRTRRRRRSRR